MEDSKIVVCRLCLNIISPEDAEEVHDVARNILQMLIPELNLDATLDPMICQSCNKTMISAYEFRNRCNEEILHTDIEIKDEGTYVTTEVENRQCNFCYNNIVNNNTFAQLKQQRSLFKEALENFFPDWNLGKSEASYPCKTCLEAITRHSAFVQTCLEKERQIKVYLTSQGVEVGKLNLYEVVQFILENETKHDTQDLQVQMENVNEECTTLSIKPENIEIKTEAKHPESPCNLSIQDELQIEPIPSTSSAGMHRILIPVSSDLSKGKKHRNQSPSTLFATKQLKTDTKMESKVERSMRDVGIQVNIRDLIRQVSVGIQVTPRDLGVKDASSEAKPDTTNKQTSCRPRSRHVSVLTKGANASQKAKMKRRIKMKK